MYNESIFTAIIGLVIIILGAINRTGNISTLHAYHRNRVSEEDRIPFGKMVGLGTIIVGFGIIAMAALSALAIALSTPPLHYRRLRRTHRRISCWNSNCICSND